MHDRRVCVKQSRIPRQRDGCMDDGTRENHSSSNFNIFLPPARHQHQHQPPANLRGHRVLKRLIITSRKCVANSFVAGRVNLEDNFIGLGCWCGGHWPGAGGGLQQCKQRHPITHQAPCTSPHTLYWPLQLQLVACNGHVVHCDNTRLQIPQSGVVCSQDLGRGSKLNKFLLRAPILCWCWWEGTSQQPASSNARYLQYLQSPGNFPEDVHTKNPCQVSHLQKYLECPLLWELLTPSPPSQYIQWPYLRPDSIDNNISPRLLTISKMNLGLILLAVYFLGSKQKCFMLMSSRRTTRRPGKNDYLKPISVAVKRKAFSKTPPFWLPLFVLLLKNLNNKRLKMFNILGNGIFIFPSKINSKL